MRLLLASVLVAMAASPASGQAWLGVAVPPNAPTSAVKVGARAPRPASGGDDALNGAAIKGDVETIVGFARQSRTSKEVGSGQMWGRIAGFPSSDNAVEWTLDQFRKAGISDIRRQSIDQDPKASLWLPLSWRVTLLGDAAFGEGTNDVVLTSALPVGPSTLAGGTLTAPLIYVGAANSAVLQHIDVKGKIAVQLIVPQGHMLFERGAVEARSAELIKRGAAGVFNLVRLPGNELSRDFSNCGHPCFNIGGRDGWFLENVLERAARNNVGGTHGAFFGILCQRRGSGPRRTAQSLSGTISSHDAA